jgi:N-acetylglucosaminyldiphosphoundecaprenol N-acetyl-beta-D-mannosaminyltransferase
VRRVALLDVQVDVVAINELNRFTCEAVRGERNVVIANHNLHSVYLFQRDARMRAYYEMADLIHFDGMSLVLWGKVMGTGLRREHRVSYLDWIASLLAMADRECWRIFILGGREEITAAAAARIAAAYPHLSVSYHHGYFDMAGAENGRVLERINRAKPQLLFLSMGMPRQEEWILNNRHAVECNAIFQAGACFDYLAGAVYVPPRWVGRIGLEWLFRLCTSPRRVYKRYLWEPWFILPLCIADLKKKHRANRQKG